MSCDSQRETSGARVKVNVTEQDCQRGVFPGQTPSPHHVLCLPLIYRRTLAFSKFQKINLITEVRKYRNKGNKQDKIIIAQPLNNVKDLRTIDNILSHSL